MQCPACSNVTLVMSERQGIEIDYCPQCRGIWLDRGELDKILERDAAATTSAPPPPPQGYAGDPRRHDQGGHGDRHGGDRHSGGGKYGKKRNFLSDLLDF